jgi:hypothetical protein
VSGLLSRAHRIGAVRVHLVSPLLDTRTGWSLGSSSTSLTDTTYITTSLGCQITAPETSSRLFGGIGLGLGR